MNAITEHAPFLAHTIQTNHKGHISGVRVPGLGGVFHDVYVRRNDGRFEMVCKLDTGIGHIPCEESVEGVCSHQIAALKYIVRESGYSAVFHKKESRVANIYKTTFPLVSRYSKKRNDLFVSLKKNEDFA